MRLMVLFERDVWALDSRAPAAAQRLRAALDEHRTLNEERGKAVGGEASAPSPGWLLRAALASCDATLVAMEAARDGIDLTGLEVAVESDSDFRGVLGVDDATKPGPLAVRVRIQLTSSDATQDQLQEIVERAEMRSPVRDALARAVPMATEIVTRED
jgi:uncharacterized OsmC-like protein